MNQGPRQGHGCNVIDAAMEFTADDKRRFIPRVRLRTVSFALGPRLMKYFMTLGFVLGC